MQTTLLILIVTATIVTSIIDFAKPAYEQLAWKYAVTINILLSFWLGIAWAFAVSPFLSIELSSMALVLLWLAIGTWATVFYDIIKLLRKAWSTKDEEIVYYLDDNEDEDAENQGVSK